MTGLLKRRMVLEVQRGRVGGNETLDCIDRGGKGGIRMLGLQALRYVGRPRSHSTQFHFLRGRRERSKHAEIDR